ncbi:hypothetical protein KY495_20530 [Massilia sp. PAMC28688]|uniref:hypothetical protein n=1 Tax=Massilia sp. PAMC28688 TaxID=2861283 RepID=UPI001C6383A1|nr:hypothetical protein [Massilia sp. PAMC28688]QYF93056.1 hypothetical protein KY495_20530 [Massilia sp. PAMC28688]
MSSSIPSPLGELELQINGGDNYFDRGGEEGTIIEIMKPWNEIIGNDLLRVAHDRLQQTKDLINQKLSDKLRNVSQPIDSNDPQYQAYCTERENFEKLHALTLNYHDAAAEEKVTLIENLYESIAINYGDSSIRSKQVVLQAIREAKHFITTGNFLNQSFWLEHDPMNSDALTLR